MANIRTVAAVIIFATVVVTGFLGLSVRHLFDAGFSAVDTAGVRVIVVILVIFVYLVLFHRDQLRIKLRDLPFFVAIGAVKLLSDITLFYATGCVSLALATLLQTTAPYYVLFLSLFLFKERITTRKLLSVMVAFVGCTLVTGVLSEDLNVSQAGIVSAIFSGLFYGLFFIGCKVGHDRGYEPSTSTFYMFLFSLLFLLPFLDYGHVAVSFTDLGLLPHTLLLGILYTLIPYYACAWGTKYLEASTIAVISVVEVVSAALVGFFFYSEGMSLLNVCGMFLILASIVLMNLKAGPMVQEKVAPKYAESSEDE